MNAEGVTLSTIVDFNPTRKIVRGANTPFVDMAALPIDARDINEIGERIFNGGGSKFQDGDTLFARITPCLENGKTSKVKGLGRGVVAHGSTEFIVMSAKDPEHDEDYVYYFARLPEFRLFAVARMEGTSGRQRVTWQSLADFKFNFPDKYTRKEAGIFLATLDNKIELNRQINQTLEQMAQAIFKSWFVDFDPVHAKVLAIKEGRDPIEAAARVIGNPALKQIGTSLREIAELLPSEFVESELGLIPKGWEVSQIGEEVTIFGGGTPSTKNPDFWQQGEFYWATPRDLSNLSDKILQETERKISRLGVGKISSGQLPKGTVLMSSRAPVGYLALADTPISINQGFIAMVADKSLPNHYVLQWAEATMEEIKNRASGTTFAEISKKSFRTISVIVPSEKILNSYDFTLSNIYGGIRTKLSEIKTLTLLRDTLLPKLLSGEIRVGDVEQQVREVQ